MAWIKKKKKTYKREYISDKTKAVKKIYNTKRWRDLRKAKLMESPLCEVCLEESPDGITGISAATEVHHIIPISTGDTEEEMMELGFSSSNLKSLCQYHHHEIHKQLESGFLNKSTAQRT